MKAADYQIGMLGSKNVTKYTQATDDQASQKPWTGIKDKNC